jgi:hypothetical protein
MFESISDLFALRMVVVVIIFRVLLCTDLDPHERMRPETHRCRGSALTTFTILIKLEEGILDVSTEKGLRSEACQRMGCLQGGG